MRMTATERKLSELRARTDSELTALINRNLELGLILAEDRSLEEAERVYLEAATLLPAVYGITVLERRRMESRLHELRGTLDCIAAGFRARTAGAA